MKKLVFVLVVVVAAFIAGIGFILFNLDALVKELVEKVGTEMTQTSVTLDSANIDPANGKASLSGLNVKNPAGYKEPDAFSLDLVSVKMDPTTVTGDVILIHEIVVAAPQVTLEMKDDNSNNLQDIQANVEAFLKDVEKKAAEVTGGETSAESSQASDAGGEATGPKVIIEHVYIRDVESKVNLALLGGETVSIPAPDVHLEGIGKKENGVLIEEAVAEIVDRFLGDMEANALSSEAVKMFNQVEEEVTKAVEEVSKEVEAVSEEVSKELEGVADEAKDALDSLFGN